jgi:hypothetical protein
MFGLSLETSCVAAEGTEFGKENGRKERINIEMPKVG